MINYRRATDNDFEKLLNLIEAGFSVQSESKNSPVNMRIEEGREHRILFSYLYSKDPFSLGRVHLAEEQGELIAAVGFFPQRLFFGTIKIPVWAISPVVSHPAHRGRGVAGSCLVNALENLKQQGVPAVFLWGLPYYYPRFGFVPLLPRYKTKFVKKQSSDTRKNDKFIMDGGFRNATIADIEMISDLYNQGNHRYWLQPERSLEWWRFRFAEMDIEAAAVKEVPFPRKNNFLVWEINPGELGGYLYYEIISGQKRLVIPEGAASDPKSAMAMMYCFIRDYLDQEWTLLIRGTPEHLLNAALYRMGGVHINPAPLAGMLKIIDWELILNVLKPLLNERLKNWNAPCQLPDMVTSENIIRWQWNPDAGIIIKIDRSGHRPGRFVDETRLTRLLFAGFDELDQLYRQKPLMQTVFPVKYPYIWDTNYLY